MEVVPNPALAALLLLPFLVTMAALYFILFKPLLAYLGEREHAVVGSRAEAQQLNHTADARVKQLESQLVATREAIATTRAAARGRAAEQQALIVGKARKAADAQLAAAITDIAAEQGRAAGSIGPMAQSLAGDIVTQVLGRPAGGN